LACFGGHITVVGLLLSRSAELLHSGDKHGKTGLHIAAQHGRYQMCEVLLGQGAEINATDKVSSTHESTIEYLCFESCEKVCSQTVNSKVDKFLSRIMEKALELCQ
jgi:hypothetical protein